MHPSVSGQREAKCILQSYNLSHAHELKFTCQALKEARGSLKTGFGIGEREGD